DTRAFERDIDAEFLPGQLRRILDGGDLEFFVADADRVAVDRDFVRKTAMHAVIAQQMGVGLDRPEVIDRHHVDVLAAGFVDGAYDVSADAAKSVDGNSDGHLMSPWECE